MVCIFLVQEMLVKASYAQHILSFNKYSKPEKTKTNKKTGSPGNVWSAKVFF